MAEKNDKKKDSKLPQLDKRVIDRMIQRGAVSRPDFEAHLKALPDLTEQADNIADKVYTEQ
jgi:hypothetical protein